MPKSHPPYPPEFRRRMVELVRAGRTPEALAREFEPTAQSIHNWVAQADRDEGRRSDGLMVTMSLMYLSDRQASLMMKSCKPPLRKGASC